MMRRCWLWKIPEPAMDGKSPSNGSEHLGNNTTGQPIQRKTEKKNI